jgi:voltage-gated potassium channel
MTRSRLHMYNLLWPDDDNRAGKSLDTFIIVLIAFNVLMIVLESEQTLAGPYGGWFRGFEYFSSIFFTIEYALRTWSCVENPRFGAMGPVRGRLRYALTFFAVIDFVAIAPFYLPMLISLDLRFVRAIRLFRLFRLFKMGRYSTSIKFIVEVFRRRKEELAMTIFVVLIVLILAASLLYFVENGAQPEAFGSIPDAMWWGVITLTTVGYGDVYPITGLGRFLGAFIALIGVGMVALPAGLIASGFNEIIQEKAGKISKMRNCPHCGYDLKRVMAKGVRLDDDVEEHIHKQLSGLGHTTPAQQFNAKVEFVSMDARSSEYKLDDSDTEDALGTPVPLPDTPPDEDTPPQN